MLSIEMPRRDTKLRLDERILGALREKSVESGISFNALCEGILFSYAKSIGKLPISAEPLGDNRGGKREGVGRKKTKTTAAVNPLVDVQKEESLELPETVVGVELDKKSVNPIDVDPKIINGD